MIQTLTFAQLMRGTTWNISWGRVIIPRAHPEEWHSLTELQDLLGRMGDRAVLKVQPGYWFLLVWLE